MDLAATVRLVDGWFRQRERPWALIGGLAMGALGYLRATFDVDRADIASRLRAAGLEDLWSELDGPG